MKQVAFAAAAAGGTASAALDHPIGFQLYTLRERLAKDAAAMFRSLAATGYTEVEALRQNLDVMAPLLTEAGFRIVSGHFDTPLITGNWDVWNRRPNYIPPPKGYDWKSAVEQARGVGMKYMVVPYIIPGERGGADVFKAIARKLTAAAESCRAAGMKLCYHHHAFEFQPVEGVRPLDVFMGEIDRDLLGLEVDVFWASVAGVDPAGLLKKYSGRVPLIHIKDKAKGTEQSFDEPAVPRSAFREVGNGVLDIPAILRAAADAGVEHYIVEQDYCSGDPVESLRQSFRYLRNH
jgi:sugar phosphate isomerase/epimerase